MNTYDARFESSLILGQLSVSASELGYRAQALFAEILVQMGASIDSVARVGHPDVTARIGGRILRIQVKATRQSTFSLSTDDAIGIRPLAPEDDGYLAVLDLEPPMRWICVRYERAKILVGRTVPIAFLKSMDEAPFSTECTNICANIVLKNRAIIEAFTFDLLRKRALVDD